MSQIVVLVVFWIDEYTTVGLWFYRTNGVFLYNYFVVVLFFFIFSSQYLDLLIFWNSFKTLYSYSFPLKLSEFLPVLVPQVRFHTFVLELNASYIEYSLFFFFPHLAIRQGEWLAKLWRRSRWNTGNDILEYLGL